MSLETLKDALKKDKEGKLFHEMQTNIRGVLTKYGITDPAEIGKWESAQKSGKLKDRINTLQIGKEL